VESGSKAWQRGVMGDNDDIPLKIWEGGRNQGGQEGRPRPDPKGLLMDVSVLGGIDCSEKNVWGGFLSYLGGSRSLFQGKEGVRVKRGTLNSIFLS